MPKPNIGRGLVVFAYGVQFVDCGNYVPSQRQRSWDCQSVWEYQWLRSNCDCLESQLESSGG